MHRLGVPWAYPCQDPGRCLKYDGPRRMKGLWRNDFEGSQFCPAPAKTCGYVMSDKRTNPVIWLDFSVSLPADHKGNGLGGLYAIDFIGRRSAYPGYYGHMGVFDEEVIVDRMISMKEIEPPPKK